MTSYVIKPAKYAGRWNGKPQMAVHCKSDGSGYKTKAMYACDELKARYSNRENAYIMSPAKSAKFEKMMAE